MKYQPTAMRRNVHGKPDYFWTATYANGNPVLFDMKEQAIGYAQKVVEQKEHSMYQPGARERA